MDQTIIFSNPTQILHTELLPNSQILLTTPTQLILFSLSTAKVMKQYTISQQVMPIQTWVISKSQAQLTNQQHEITQGVKDKDKYKDKDFTIVIQGKMGFNFIFYLSQGQFKDGHKYRTGVCGFCKMVLVGEVVVGVCQEGKTVLFIDVFNGDIQFKALFDEQKLCQSITCISLTSPISKPSILSTLYLAQQGCHIHKLMITPTSPNQDRLAQKKESITLPNKNQIKLITNLIQQNNKMFCIMRKCPIVYIIGTQPNLSILQSIDCQLINPRCLVLVAGGDGEGKGRSLAVADGNKIVRCEGKGKGRVFGQVKQSKNVEYMSCRGRVVYGCTQEKQFFYLQL